MVIKPESPIQSMQYWLYYAWFWQTVYFQQFLLDSLRVNYSVNIETYFSYNLVVIYVSLNAKPLKECMYFWLSTIACTKLNLLYIHYTNNGLIPVVQKRIIYIMVRVRRINLSIILFLEIIFLSIFQAYTLALRVYFKAYILDSRNGNDPFPITTR